MRGFVRRSGVSARSVSRFWHEEYVHLSGNQNMDRDRESEAPGVSNAGPAATPREYDWTGVEQLRAAVVEGVAAATDRTPEDVTPPDSHVDLETLEEVLASGSGGEVSVSFVVDGAPVTVAGDGTLEVWPREAGPGRRIAAPRSDSAFEGALERLFGAAFENGVDVRGGWVIRNEVPLPDLDVHVAQVAKSDDDPRAARRGDRKTE